MSSSRLALEGFSNSFTPLALALSALIIVLVLLIRRNRALSLRIGLSRFRSIDVNGASLGASG